MPAPRPSRDRDELETVARARSAGLHDAELKKRRRLGLELVEELRRPLIKKHGPSDLEHIARLRPRARPPRPQGKCGS